MAAQDNLSKKQFPAMYHGTRAHIVGGVVMPAITEGETRMARAWATSDPGQARFFGETKLPKGAENNPVKVYKVQPVSDKYEETYGNVEGEKFYTSPHGFMITGEHK